MLQPKNYKYSKIQKGKNKGVKIGMEINFGIYAIKALERGRITSSQIESTRRVISKKFKKEGKIWIRIFPDRPFTKKPLEVRMGKGKGNLEFWYFYIKPGFIIYEMDNIDFLTAKDACKSASFKLPIKIALFEKNIKK